MFSWHLVTMQHAQCHSQKLAQLPMAELSFLSHHFTVCIFSILENELISWSWNHPVSFLWITISKEISSCSRWKKKIKPPQNIYMQYQMGCTLQSGAFFSFFALMLAFSSPRHRGVNHHHHVLSAWEKWELLLHTLVLLWETMQSIILGDLHVFSHLSVNHKTILNSWFS